MKRHERVREKEKSRVRARAERGRKKTGDVVGTEGLARRPKRITEFVFSLFLPRTDDVDASAYARSLALALFVSS